LIYKKKEKNVLINYELNVNHF